MIYTKCNVRINNDTATIDHKIILYKGDKNVEIQFKIVESLYKQYKIDGVNIILNLDASYGQLVIDGPNGSIFSEITPTKDGEIIFTIPEEMTDEDIELGQYSFQIRLFDETKTSRVTLPPVQNGLEIKEPIADDSSGGGSGGSVSTSYDPETGNFEIVGATFDENTGTLTI